MKLLRIALLCLLSSLAFGQVSVSRYDNFAWTVQPVTGVPVMRPIPNVTISVCSYPAVGLPCTNTAPIYTDSTGTTLCNGLNGCSNPMTTGADGAFGFWSGAGHFQYTVSIGTTNYGTYDVTLGGGTGAQLNAANTWIAPQTFTVGITTQKINGILFADQYTNIQAAITAAGTTGSVVIPAFYAGSDTFTNPNNIVIKDLRKQRGIVNAVENYGMSTAATGAFNAAALASAFASGKCVFIPFGTYTVASVTIPAGGCLKLENRNTVLQPVSTAQTEILKVSGASIASPSSYVYIEGGILNASSSMNSGTAGIRILYGNFVTIKDTIVNGFYDNIFADNTFFLDLEQVKSNGATDSNLWHQHSDTTHGPYFGGPLTIRGGTFNSASGPYSLHVTDIAAVTIEGTQVVGTTNGVAAYFNSSNGIPASPSDYPNAVHIHASTFDTSANELLQIQNYTKSDVVGNWFSGGRLNSKSCIGVGSSANVNIQGNDIFWCGLDGINIGTTNQAAIIGNNSAGSPGDGIHISVGATHATVLGNTCNSTKYSGSGATEAFCVYEEATASNNIFVANDPTGTTSGNSYNGTSPTYFEASGAKAAILTLGTLNFNHLLVSPTAPTIASGFGTSPSITANNGTAAFEVNVGTGGTASSGVITLPTASNGWNCSCNDITTQSTSDFLCKQTASSTTSATITEYNTAGAATAWVASDKVRLQCSAY